MGSSLSTKSRRIFKELHIRVKNRGRVWKIHIQGGKLSSLMSRVVNERKEKEMEVKWGQGKKIYQGKRRGVSLVVPGEERAFLGGPEPVTTKSKNGGTHDMEEKMRRNWETLYIYWFEEVSDGTIWVVVCWVR